MPTNIGFTMSYNGNAGYIPLYPNTVKDQVLGYSLGETNAPIQITLQASNWTNKQQTIALTGVSPTDIITCVKVLSGTEEQMLAQNTAYNMLDPYIGINSISNGIVFTCTNETPTVDFTVQVEWTR